MRSHVTGLCLLAWTALAPVHVVRVWTFLIVVVWFWLVPVSSLGFPHVPVCVVGTCTRLGWRRDPAGGTRVCRRHLTPTANGDPTL